MRKRKLIIWQQGPVYGAFLYVDQGIIAVTNNGEVWSAELFSQEPKHLVPAGVQMFVAPSLSTRPPEWRLPCEWAKKVAKAAGVKHSTIAQQTAESHTYDGITYTGFYLYAKRSAHTLTQVHKIIFSALDKVQRAWGWSCTGLEVKFHDTSRAFGLAYSPGTGLKEGVRKISLNVRLLAQYDAASVERVVLHELCHHYREENWPRNLSGHVSRRGLDISHDNRFCEALALVDPVASDPRYCMTFLEQPDPSIVAAKKPRNEVQPVWTPESGDLEMRHRKDGGVVIYWIPKEGVTPRWRAVSVASVDHELLELMKRFRPSQWQDVRVTHDERAKKTGKLFAVKNLSDWVRTVEQNWSRYFPKSLGYLGELRGQTAP